MASINEAERIQRLLISELPDSFTPPPGYKIISQQVIPAQPDEKNKRPTLQVELMSLNVPEMRCNACGSTRIRQWGEHTYSLQDLPTKTHCVELVFTGRRIRCLEKTCDQWTTNIRVSKDIESDRRLITKRLEDWMFRWADKHYLPDKHSFSRLTNYSKLSQYIGIHRNSIRIIFSEWAEKQESQQGQEEKAEVVEK